MAQSAEQRNTQTGIQNPQRQTRTVTDDFARKDLRNRIAQQRLNPKSANDNMPAPETERVARSATTAPRGRIVRPQSRAATPSLSRTANKNIVISVGYPLAWACFYVQLLFAIPALIFFVLAGVAGGAGGSIIGAAQSFGGVPLVGSMLTGASSLVSMAGESVLGGTISIGMLLSVCAIAVAIICYGAAALMLRMSGITLFTSVGTTLLTIFCLVLDMIPIVQILPWMLVWVFAIQMNNILPTINAAMRA